MMFGRFYTLKQLRSTHQSCSVKKDALKNFAKFTAKHLCWSLFLIKLKACKSFCSSGGCFRQLFMGLLQKTCSGKFRKILKKTLAQEYLAKSTLWFQCLFVDFAKFSIKRFIRQYFWMTNVSIIHLYHRFYKKNTDFYMPFYKY